MALFRLINIVKLRSSILNSRGIILLILILASLGWMAYLPLRSPQPEQLVPDSLRYIHYAEHFFSSLKEDTVRTPGYPFFLACIRTLSECFNIPFYRLTYLFQSLLFLSGIYLLSEIIRKKGFPRVSILFVFMLVINPSFFIYNFLFLTETLFLFLLCVCVYFFHEYLLKENNSLLLGSLFCSCIATLVRPGWYYLNILFLLAILIYLLRKKQWLPVFISLCIYGGTVLSYQTFFYANHQVFKISMIDDITRHRYLKNAVVGTLSGEDLSRSLFKQDSLDDQIFKTFKSEDRLLAERDYYRKQWQQTISGHSYTVLTVFLKTIFENIHTGNTMAPNSISVNKREVLFNLTRIWNMFYTALFMLELLMVLGFKRSAFKTPLLLLFSVFIFYHYITSGVSFWQGDRLLIACQPLILCSALLFFHTLWKNNSSDIRGQKFHAAD